MCACLTFDESVDLGEPADDAVSAVALSDVNPRGKQSIAWLRVDQRNTHSRLGGGGGWQKHTT